MNTATDPLDGFSPATTAWFASSFAEPTAAQAGAWQAVRAGGHALVVAPTGSGKTLAAFLWALDRLVAEPAGADERAGTRVLYVSPLKALAVDVERNLRAPLAGITQASRRLGLAEPSVSVGMRTGDTPATQRRQLARTPPDVLITTPESLYLMLTSAVRETLRGVRTVIVDEVHAVAGSKRGAHLAVTLERLDALLPAPAQRIGLSATVRPLDTVARFLGGRAPVTVVAPEAGKQVDVQVVVPVPDLAELPVAVAAPSSGPAPVLTGPPLLTDEALQTEAIDTSGGSAVERLRPSIWPHVEERIADLVTAHRSTIVFANSRRLAERLTSRLNEIATERAGGEPLPEDPSPAELMAQSGASRGAASLLARAHHGSVSKEQRALIEDDLKSGRLPCVVATSSLELGIDMGLVDLVIQVEAPPSVASGLQRIGRAGHHVGAVSRGVLFPKFRGDLAPSAVAAERMRTGLIEELHVPANPLDVLAQQVLAAVSLDDWDVDELYQLMRRAAPFDSLPRSAYEAIVDMLAGRYPSDEFAQLRPRLVWDRAAGTLSARPGAQRLAVTSGGTIPDRGLFGVYLVGQTSGARVGELDEEMVYESRVGDVFSLGASSWRIEDITHDRVLVSPAPGQPGRLPFWKGDALGRPPEFGRALGAFVRELGRLDDAGARGRLAQAGLDEWAADNLLAYLREQREATGRVPDDRQLVVERFRDELGDWRVCLHSPYGAAVHGPWSLAVAARLAERYGVDAQAVAADDGIVLRVPETDADPPGAEVFAFEPDEIEDIVTEQVGGSALFAARFRECAARALLLPRRDPGRRTPLWQQRMRSAQLLEVASRYGSFPIVLEALREVLRDVYDLDALTGLLRDLANRRVRMVEVQTPTPSPFAGTLTFGYVANFLYEGDTPLAERRAAALSVDPALLGELLGRAQLRDLLDADVVAEAEEELQRRAPHRRAHDLEGVADLLRDLGPCSVEEVQARVVADADPDAAARWLARLVETRRAIEVRVAGVDRFAAVEDAPRLRDALGVPPPVGLPAGLLEPVTDPLGDLVSRFARTHAPFVVSDVAGWLGLGTTVVTAALARLAGGHRVEQGEFTPGRSGEEWCDTGVLRMLRRRSLAALRHQVEPVEPAALGRFLPAWQHVTDQVRGVDGLLRVVEQLAGAPVPASALESLVLPARVADYVPGMLDELTTAGEVVWCGRGSLPGPAGGWVSLHPADTAELTLPPVPDDLLDDLFGEGLVRRVAEVLSPAGAYFFRQLSDALAETGEPVDDGPLEQQLWDLVWAGLITNDTIGPLRTLVSGGRGRRSAAPAGRLRRSPRGRMLGRPQLPSRTGPPTMAGRWSLLPTRQSDSTRRLHALVETLLDRHGVVTRGAVSAERVSGGFAAVYRVLSAFEDTGRARRGYFIGGLGAAQFGVAGAVDRLRAEDETVDGPRKRREPVTVVLAATDPANPYGAALPWPPGRESAGGHRPGRKAGALVVLVNGRLAIYVEAGGRTLLSYSDDDEVLVPAARELAGAVHAGALGRLAVERADGESVHDSALSKALQTAGFTVTPRGLRLRR